MLGSHGNLHFDSQIWCLELKHAHRAQQDLLSGGDAHPALGWLMDLEASPRSAVKARLLSSSCSHPAFVAWVWGICSPSSFWACS